MKNRDLLELTTEAELNNNVDAQAALALLCEQRRVISDPHLTFACYWYQRAAAQGHVASSFQLGRLYYRGDGFPPQPPTSTSITTATTASNTNTDQADHHQVAAVPWLRNAAEQGHVDAQYYLGWMALEGLGGIPQSDSVAVFWFRKAAEQGHLSAQNNLGWMYNNGRGVDQNYVEAVRWYRLAASQGYTEAQCNLGIMYENGLGVERNVEEAVYWYHQGAMEGNASSQFSLGIMYFYGNGVEQDDAAAMSWFYKAAEQGNKYAQCNVAWLHNLGRGAVEDDQISLSWYLQSAEQQCKEAEWSLGFLYEVGLAVDQDDDEALAWYEKASVHGKDSDTELHTELIKSKRAAQAAEGDNFDLVEWYRQQAEAGNAAASYNLGAIFEKGIAGKTKDYPQAAKWFQKALDQGHESGKERLKKLLGQ
ncbi:hypothetical protein BGW41_006158 [Actinomortierella wolfii]|nr:hypothetical protein BGW41_006158 [Actinomortierella wolfii]